MLPQPILAPWARLFASLALEVILVFALTALLACLIRPASGQRMVWRGSFVVIAALVLAEFSGLGHSLLQNLRVSTPAPPPSHTLVTTVVTTDTLAPPTWAPPTAKIPVVPAVNLHENLLSTLALWLPGLALAGLVWLVLRRSFGALKLMRLERQGLADAGDLAARVQALGRRLCIRRRVRVKSIAGLSSPIAFGMFRPTVGVPGDFSIRFTPAQQDAMLAHELAHVAAFDAAWMLLADFITALLWWHPGAWWARRQLRAASETAADEASLLLEDGPATLAECLVALGDLLTRSPHPGGLGMAGFRFRSELGRRVERLLHLRDGSRHPWRGTTVWLARLLVPATLLALALAITAWLLPPAAGAATIGEAFQGSPLGLATTALLTADKHDAPGPTYKGKQLHELEKTREAETNDVRTLLLLGKKLYDTGNTNEAEAKWRRALELDPRNIDYLTQIGHTNFPAIKDLVRPNEAPIPRQPSRTNLVCTSNARQKIYQRLNSIRLESVKFDGVPLTQAIEQVAKAAKKRDPDQKGVNIIVSSTADTQAAAPAIDPAAGLPVAGAVAGAEADISATTVTINPELRDVTLGQALDTIVKMANRPIRYSVEDYGILFTSGGPENPVLHTRWFKIDPNTFMHRVKESAAKKFDAWEGNWPLHPGASEDIATELVRTYLHDAGILLNPPRKIAFNDRLGVLMVRATWEELDVIEQTVAVLNTAPLQVLIEVKFCEVTEESFKALGFDFLLGSVASGPLGAPAERGRNSDSSQNRADSNHRNALTNASSDSLTGILTPQQFAVILRAMEQRQGVNILATPKVITPTGRQAQLKMVDVQTIVIGLDPTTNAPPAPGQPPEHPLITEQMELGPTVDIVPYVAADGRTIQMTVIPSIKEFLGYDKDETLSKGIWDYVPSPGANPPPGSQLYPVPVVRVRQIVSSLRVWDGQTIVLASRTAKIGVPESHIANKLPKELTEQLVASIQRMQKSPPKAMVVFITPTIVDAAGNLVHTDADIPERNSSFPAQPRQMR